MLAYGRLVKELLALVDTTPSGVVPQQELQQQGDQQAGVVTDQTEVCDVCVCVYVCVCVRARVVWVWVGGWV